MCTHVLIRKGMYVLKKDLHALMLEGMYDHMWDVHALELKVMEGRMCMASTRTIYNLEEGLVFGPKDNPIILLIE